jgi:hypothetical protein
MQKDGTRINLKSIHLQAFHNTADKVVHDIRDLSMAINEGGEEFCSPECEKLIRNLTHDTARMVVDITDYILER